MTPTQMTAALAVRSARAEPIIPDGWQLPNGYILHGPRGNKGCVFVDANGNVDEFWIGRIERSLGPTTRASRRAPRRASLSCGQAHEQIPFPGLRPACDLVLPLVRTRWSERNDGRVRMRRIERRQAPGPY